MAMRIDSPGLATDLALLELEGSTITDRGDHLVIRTEANPTYYWGNFILLEKAPSADQIPSWIERFEAEFPQAAHRTFGIVEVDADHSPWGRHGYDVESDVALAAERLNAPPTPSLDVEVRVLGSDDDWEQSAQLAALDAGSQGHEERLLFERRRAEAERRQSDTGSGRYFGAFVDGRLVSRLGIVVLGERARFRFVVTHPDFRRRGIAGALVHTAGTWALAQPDVEQVVIVADEDGPAIGLYRSLGFAEAGRHVGVEKAPAS